VRDGRCVTWGYNGAPPGLPHCQHLGDVMPCTNATHAEANALAFAARQGISTEGGTLYVTLSPCDVCARLLIAAGIERVVYEEEYRDPSGIELLTEAGVKCLSGTEVSSTT
jgi:dCMP deaminase